MLPAPFKNSKIVTSVKLGIKGLVPIDIRSMIIPIVMTGLRPSLCVIKYQNNNIIFGQIHIFDRDKLVSCTSHIF